MCPFIAAAVLFVGTTAFAAPKAVVTNCTRLAQIITSGEGAEDRFDLRHVNAKSTVRELVVYDRFAAVKIVKVPQLRAPKIQDGDIINARGFISRNKMGERTAHTEQLTVLAHGEPDPLRLVSFEDFSSPTNNFRLVQIEGVVRDVITDETDPKYSYLVLLHRDGIIFTALSEKLSPAQDIRDLINTRVTVTGFCQPRLYGNRKFFGRTLQTTAIKVMGKRSAVSFDAPDLSALLFKSAAEISKTDRHKTFGRILAVLNKGAAVLLQTDECGTVRASLLDKHAPSIGETVEVVGFPTSNSHFLDLEHAVWQPATRALAEEPSVPQPVTAKEILSNDFGQPMIHPDFHGKTIRLTGVIHNLHNSASGTDTIFLEDEGYLVPVDLSGCPAACNDISTGCKISVTGICVMDIENRSFAPSLPHIRGFTLVPRSLDDISIVSRPPWLNRERLLVVVGGLVLLLFGILAWNASLRILANRRGRELFRSQVGKIASELRVKERTRLAVELHDSLAQNLTGVSMEIEAAERSRKDGLEAVSQHLVIADKALKSCRAELRNSLWDLRSQALEEPDLDKAIRQTLLPHVKGISLFVRFNVPRSRFSDNTLHEILRIIRELSLNGIRHGGATEIRIAGAIDGDLLRFSVQDNGCGFDPDDHPGVTDGHFGLQGISERLDTYSGELSFSSAPGKGTKAVVTIPLPGQKDPEK